MKDSENKPDFQPGDVVKYRRYNDDPRTHIVNKIELDDAGNWRVWYDNGGFDYPTSIKLVYPRENKTAQKPQYKIISADGLYPLELRVSKLIAEGFEPIGGVSSVGSCSVAHFVQAMIKR